MAETFRWIFPNSMTIQFVGDASALESLVRRKLADINPNLTLIDFKSLDYQVAGNFNQERLIARLTTLFGLLALVLASVGLYGITAYSVARRTSEIGVRMALGANRGNVVALVLRGASLQVGLGLAIGVPVALLGGHFMSSGPSMASTRMTRSHWPLQSWFSPRLPRLPDSSPQDAPPASSR